MDLQDEESDAPQVNEDVAEWPSWSGYLQHAWRVLRDDRSFGAMGGMGGIYYESLSRYAHDNAIPLEPFVTFMQAMDSVYMKYAAEQASKKPNEQEE